MQEFCTPLLSSVLRWIVLRAAVLIFTCSCMLAQVNTASITGSVTDPTGALVPSALVSLSSSGHRLAAATTDAFGGFRFPAIAPGGYTLSVEATGFRIEQRELQMRPGETLRLAISLKIEVQREQVAVSSDILDSSPDHNQSAIVLKGSELATLSSNPQQLQLQIQAMAGGEGGAKLFVDGFTANRLPPASSIREIRINENPFSAQFDTTGSGRVEILTKPGTDAIHGTLTLLGEDSALNSRNPFVQEQPAYSSFFSDGAISGPVTKSSAWFLTGDQQTVGAQSFIHAVTSATGPAYTATISSPQTSVDAGPRIDFQLGKIQAVSMRYQFGHQTQDNLVQNQLSLESQAIDTRHTDQTFQFSDAQVYGPRVINESRFQFMRTNDSSVSIDGTPTILAQGAFVGGGNNLGQLHDGENHYELQNYTSILLGQHLLRTGARFRYVQDGNFSSAGFNGQFIFPSIDAYEITEQGLANGLTPAEIRALGGGASQFSIIRGETGVTVNVADFGTYLEDEWKMTPNMTLTPGLRFETQSGIPDHADFGPRVSYAWAIGASKDKAAKAVLRAGIGIFYDRFPTDLLVNAARQNGVLQKQYVVNFPDFYPNVPPTNMLGPATLPTIYRISPTLHAPITVQESVGLDKEFFKHLTLSVDYTYYRGVDQLITRNINAPLPGTYNPTDPTSGIRPLGTLQNIYEYDSLATTKRQRIFTNFHLNLSQVLLYGYYIFGYSHSDTGGPSSFPSNQYNLNVDYGRANDDLRNRLYMGGLIGLPFGLKLNPFLVAQSNAPFNITVGEDLNGDSQFNDRPAFATDLNRPSVYRTKWGNFDADPLPGQKIIPINYGTGPALVMLNLGLTRNISFGPPLPEQPSPAAAGPGKKAPKMAVARRYTMNLGIQGQNIFNTVNGGTPVGVLGSSLFGESTTLSTTQFSSSQANRILYLRLRLDF
ncbi:MAG TPA: carboxypeptidase regulatory-like domain-containing protein [Silvibacterium sp.]|nr:carboxypeptidase regulatory-like domain-containing protein [Silvibacterium sp.]